MRAQEPGNSEEEQRYCFMEDNSISIGLAPQYALNMESMGVHRNFKSFTGFVESTRVENRKDDWLFTLGIIYRFKI